MMNKKEGGIMEQLNLFDIDKLPYIITKPIRLIELFAGIGSQAKALENLKANFEHYRVCEFDKYAIKSYNAIHGTNFEPSDITKIHAEDLGIVDTDEYEYIMTYSFPCQDLSLAGLGKGMEKGSGTRSGLLWEVERLLNECKELPQILLMENVIQVHSVANIENFRKWLKYLDELGYSNYFEDLNSKDFEIPQSRERCFMVSILGNYKYSFPHKKPLKLRLKDMLENDVEEKYYIINKFKIANDHINIPEATKKGYNEAYEGDGVYINRPHQKRGVVQHEMIQTLKTSLDVGVVVNEPICLNSKGGRNGIEGLQPSLQDRVYDSEAISTAITTGFMPNFLVNESTDKIIREEPLERKGWHNYAKEVLSTNGICRTLSTQCNDLATKIKEPITLRIRKLTPKECWRLMGFTDEDFDKAAQVNSNTQLYKQAGNSIVVNVLMAIFKQLL